MQLVETDTVRVIPGIGEAVASSLDRLGIRTIKDLLYWFPRTYLDASSPVPLKQAPVGRLVAIKVVIQSVQERPSRNKRIKLLEVKVSDNSGEMTVRWFNQPFLKKKLELGSEWIMLGTVEYFRGERQMASPLLESESHILALYNQTQGINSKALRNFVNWALKNTNLEQETLPLAIISQRHLLSKKEALSIIHQPQRLEELYGARERLGFEEVFHFLANLRVNKVQLQEEPGIPIPFSIPFLQELVAQLPFTLTNGQKKAIWESLQSMEKASPMTRLLNGDVGSGKTVVAAVIAAVVARAGYQSALLVPTEILARQHFQSISRVLGSSGIKMALWTAKEKQELDEAELVVGTHAILQQGFTLPRLALVVIDEQHRFGVQQRQQLRNQQELPPHLLSMTATPIPRTLALVLYGDLTVSTLWEKPQGRLPLRTRVIRPGQREIIHQRIVEELSKGHQVFVVCPLIEEKKDTSEEGLLELFSWEDSPSSQLQEKKTVIAETERLRAEHSEYGVIEFLHGKMKPQDKQAIMQRMQKGEIQVLVATSVIEVGVDIPNATVMVIEGAERFGLAQLHQFRGRVGRNDQQAYCFLCPHLVSESILQRLGKLAETDNGFEVAELDLSLRGPGEVSGIIQSGLPEFRMASLGDGGFLQQVKETLDDYCVNNPEFLQNYREKTYSNSLANLE